MPDARLFALAGAGKLDSRKAVLAEIDRMLDDPKAQAFVRNFTNRWLELYKLGSMPPDKRQR